MSWLSTVPEPTAAELWAIEADFDLQAAELALVDAEAMLLGRPTNAAAAAYLRALLDVVDLHDFTDHHPTTFELEPNFWTPIGWLGVAS